MSENPFQSPQPFDAAIPNYSSGAEAPGALKVILIFCLIISCLGFLGSCLGSGGSAFNYAIMQSAPPANPNQPGASFTQKMNQANSAAMIPNMILMGLNCIVAPLMFAGALACLNRKSWGHGLLRWSLVGAILFVLIRALVGVYVQLKVKSAMGDGFGNAMSKGGPDPQTIAAFMSGFFWAAIIFGIIWALAQAGFYVWSFVYLNKPEVRKYLGTR